VVNVPYITELTHRGEYTYDIYSRLLKDRIVLLGAAINDDVANAVVSQLLCLESEEPDKEINLYINSPGGSATAGLAIYDTLRYVKSSVRTICIGQAASMAAVLLAAGTKGKRFALPNARILIHQPSGGAEGQAADIAIQAKEVLLMRERLNSILSEHTGHSLERVCQDTERDYYMTAEEAKQYGLVDEVVVGRDEARSRL
jgi:ATP-dependent Clp protease protease subunit